MLGEFWMQQQPARKYVLKLIGDVLQVKVGFVPVAEVGEDQLAAKSKGVLVSAGAP